MRSAHERLFCD